MIVINVLKISSIISILININNSMFDCNMNALYKYMNISYPAVALATISITVILLSFDKFFSRYPP